MSIFKIKGIYILMMLLLGGLFIHSTFANVSLNHTMLNISDSPNSLSMLYDYFDINDESIQFFFDYFLTVRFHAELLFQLELYDESLELFKALNNMSPNNQDILFQTAMCLNRLGQHSEAKSLYREALIINPNSYISEFKDLF